MLVRCGTSMDPMEMKSVADGGAETDPDRRPNIYNEMFDSGSGTCQACGAV